MKNLMTNNEKQLIKNQKEIIELNNILDCMNKSEFIKISNKSHLSNEIKTIIREIQIANAYLY